MSDGPFLRNLTGQQMGVGRKSPADFFTQQATPTMALPVRRPTPPQRLSVASAQPLDLAGLRRQVLAQAAAPTAPQSRQALMAKYGLAPTAPAPKPSPMQRLSAALPASGTPEMAGLGAAGRTMMELSGWQKATEAPSLGQILARSAEAGIGAMERKQAAEQAAAQAQAEAERQARLDELQRLNTLSQIAERQSQKAPKITTRTLPSGEKQDYVFDPENPKADQYGLAVYGEPYSDIKSVAPTAKMQEAMAIYGTLESPEAKAFLREVVGGSTKGQYQAKGTVVDSNGVELGAAVFDTSTGQTLLSVPGADGEELIPMPRGSNVVSVGQESKVIMNVNSLNQLEEQIDLSVMSMEGLTSYLESIEKAPQGLNRLYSNFVADTKTLFSDLVDADVDGKKFTDLTEKELNIALARGKLQSLIGQFRLETVGGGVMTEQDAVRILWSLGGDVNALQNRAVVKDAMTRMFKKKYKNLSRQIKQYNAQVSNPVYMNMYDAIEMPEFDESLLSQKVVKDSERTVFKKGSGKEDVVEQPAIDINIAPEGFDQADWSYLPDEDKKAYLGIGQ